MSRYIYRCVSAFGFARVARDSYDMFVRARDRKPDRKIAHFNAGKIVPRVRLRIRLRIRLRMCLRMRICA